MDFGLICFGKFFRFRFGSFQRRNRRFLLHQFWRECDLKILNKGFRKCLAS